MITFVCMLEDSFRIITRLFVCGGYFIIKCLLVSELRIKLTLIVVTTTKGLGAYENGTDDDLKNVASEIKIIIHLTKT